MEKLPNEVTDIIETLRERRVQYGSFKNVAEITLTLNRALAKGDSFHTFDERTQTALWLICNKLARLVNGTLKDDTLKDIQGYIQLIRDAEGEFK